MREESKLMLILFRIAYLYTTILYGACAALGFPGSLIGLAATAFLAMGAEARFAFTTKESIHEKKELRHIV